MAINITINTTVEQEEKLERIRLLVNEQTGAGYADIESLVKGAAIEQIKGWVRLADEDEVKRVSEVFRLLTRAERDAIVSQMNKAPVIVMAGDQAVAVDEIATLVGQVTDDGLPSGVLTYLWSFQSGPSTPTLHSTNTNANLDVSMSTAGTYVFRLTVDDGDKSDFGEISVVVS